MATSGSTDFNRNRDQVIKRAFRQCGAIALGETPSNEEMQAGAEALNAMVKSWQAEGLQLWKLIEVHVFLTVGTEEYVLGTSGDRAAADSELVVTKLNGAHASGATSIEVDSTANMAVSDAIGVVLTDGSIHWTTIATIPDSDTLTISSGLASAASDDGVVYTYTTAYTVRPLQLIDARRRNWVPTLPTDTPFSDTLSRDEYFDLPNKKDQGKPVQAYYDPQLSAGNLYIWQAPDSSSETVMVTLKQPVEDFDALADNPDFPQEWLNALSWNLAVELSPEVGSPLQERVWLKNMADEKKYLVGSFDEEPESLFFQPDFPETA